jgi:guanylate kinase
LSERFGITFVLAAPSGTGKTTLCLELLQRDAGIALSVSHTTREQRAGEIDGRHYHFVDDLEFDRLVRAGEFLEHARYNDHQYGTSWAAIDPNVANGRDMLLEIEVQGARQVRDRLSQARLIFVLPPSRAVLKQRLVDRGTDGTHEIERRLCEADREIDEICCFDYAVTNAELEACIADLLAIVRAERSNSEAQLEGLRDKFSPRQAEERFRSRDADS